MEHYLDNSATTKVSQKAAEKAFEIMTENYGNPSSLHLRGMYAEQELVKARKEVARKLGATADEIYFTSGGTEANNLAIFGVAEAKKRRGKRIVVSAVEHSSIMESAKKLEDNGFDVVYIMPREDGTIHKEDVLEKVDENTILVSVMCVNNETGAIMNISDIFSAEEQRCNLPHGCRSGVRQNLAFCVKASCGFNQRERSQNPCPEGCGCNLCEKGCPACSASLRR